MEVTATLTLKEFLQRHEREYWQELLAVCPDREQAAKIAGVSLATLYRRAHFMLEDKRRMLRGPRPPHRNKYLPEEPPAPDPKEVFTLTDNPSAGEPPPKEPVQQPKPPRSQEPKATSQLVHCLRFFGVCTDRNQLSAMDRQQLGWLMSDARVNYMRLVKANHPDVVAGRTAQMALINGSWARLRELMRKHGVGAD